MKAETRNLYKPVLPSGRRPQAGVGATRQPDGQGHHLVGMPRPNAQTLPRLPPNKPGPAHYIHGDAGPLVSHVPSSAPPSPSPISLLVGSFLPPPASQAEPWRPRSSAALSSSAASYTRPRPPPPPPPPSRRPPPVASSPRSPPPSRTPPPPSTSPPTRAADAYSTGVFPYPGHRSWCLRFRLAPPTFEWLADGAAQAGVPEQAAGLPGAGPGAGDLGGAARPLHGRAQHPRPPSSARPCKFPCLPLVIYCFGD